MCSEKALLSGRHLDRQSHFPLTPLTFNFIVVQGEVEVVFLP